METVNNLAAGASKLIWGEGNAEPVNSQTGSGTATDPYDKGNDESLSAKTAATGNTNTSGSLGPETTDRSGYGGNTEHVGNTGHTGNTNTGSTSHSAFTESIMPSTSQGQTGSSGNDRFSETTESNKPNISQGHTGGNDRFTETTGSNEPNISNTRSDTTSNTTSKAPADIHPADAGSHPEQKQQGADRPTEAPSSTEVDAIASKKNQAENAQEGITGTTGHSNTAEHSNTSHTKITSDEERNKLAEKGELPHDPNDHSGEPMKMHGGGPGGDPDKPKEGESLKEKTERSASVSHEGGGEHGKEKGTGEQWVKSSGIAADGGDFDVTKPGAGKEATRLMEEKGIKTEGATFDPDAPKDTTPGVGSSHHDEAAKVSKIAKLKEKLHIGSGKNLDK